MAARQERRLPTTGKPVPTNSSDTSVTAGEIISSPVGVIDVDESLWDAALRLSSGSRDRLVVLDRGRLVGVVDEKILTDHWPRLPFAVGERTLPRVVPRARARRQAALFQAGSVPRSWPTVSLGALPDPPSPAELMPAALLSPFMPGCVTIYVWMQIASKGRGGPTGSRST